MSLIVDNQIYMMRLPVENSVFIDNRAIWLCPLTN